MRRFLFTLCCLFCITLSHAQTTTTISSGTDVYNAGATVTFPFGFLVNNGTYYDTTSPGVVQFDGGVDLSGSGTTTVWDLHFINGGSSSFSSLISVYHTATIDAGTTVNAGANLIHIRTDLPGHADASLVVEGVLSGTVLGLITIPSATTGCGTYSSTLSTNISGSVVRYQWETSPNNATWTTIGGATNSTYVASVSSNIYYRVITTTTNSAFTNTTPGVLLNFFPAPTTLTGTHIICIGNTTNLVTTSSGGVFTSSNTAVATVGSSTGTVTGVASGSAVMTYTMAGPSCFTTFEIGVNPLPTVSSTSGNVVCSGTNSSVSAVPAAGASINWYSSLVSGAFLGAGNVLPVTAPTVTTTFYAEAVDNSLSPLITNFGGFISEPGVMFDVTMLKSILVSSFDMRCNVGTFDVEIYYKLGTLVGSENNPADWTLLTTITGSTSGSVGNRNFPLSTAINLYGGQTYAFYITGTTPTGGQVVYNAGTAVGNIAASNADLQIREGVAKRYPFTTTFSPRVANVGINYTKPSCSSSPRTAATLTVNPNPAAITGNQNVCVGFTTTLSSATSGGTWSSSNAGVASVGAGTGIVSGASAGTANITYTLGTGCFAFATVTVNPNPAAIGGGPMDVCVGLTTTLTNGTGGGTWTSDNITIATIGSASGVVTGVSGGTNYITYTLATGCYATQLITVNPLPAAISGTATVCEGLTTTLTNATSGGSWSSSAPGTASVVPGTGVVTGVAAGTATITYTLPTGCIATIIVTVNPNPASITGTTDVCTGLTTTLSSTTGGGSWSSSDVSKATVVSGTGVVTGVAAGTLTITYTLPTGCIATTAFTVNQTPAAIGGTNIVCVGSTTPLSNAVSGGTWSTSNAGLATVGALTGVVTGVSAGIPDITYTMSTGCFAFVPVTVNPLPAAIGGTTNVCVGATTTLTDADPGGTWTSSNTTMATVGTSSGIVTGVSAGTLSITYTLPTGCIATTSFVVDPIPASITGPSTVCEGLTITLANAVSGGTWSSSNAGEASVGPGTGIVTGVTASTPTITYTLPAGCFVTKPISVNPSPVAISGASGVCEGLTTTLTDATAGGTWTSSNTSFATVGSATGVVTGIAAGTLDITYTLPAGCFAVHPMTVDPTPAAITGTMVVCAGATTPLNNVTSGGTWSSSNTALATVGATSGIVTGVAAGNPVITYTLPAGCFATATITVNAQPDVSVFTSPSSTSPCQGNAATVTVNSTSIGSGTYTVTYNLSGANTATSYTATLTMGASSGTFTIPSTALPNTGSTTVTITLITNSLGCTSSVSSSNTAAFTVNILPTAYTVMGTGSYCAGGAGIHVFVSNSVGGVDYQLYLGGSPVGSPVPGTFAALDMGAQTAAGNYTVVGTNTTTLCSTIMTGSATITIDPLPTAYAVTGGGSYCAGGTGVAIGLANSQNGVDYQLWVGGSPSGSPVAGTGGVISFGLRTAAGTYTVVATDATTTCVNNMTGSVTVIIDPLPAAITGTTDVCVGLTTTLASASPGGTWTSVNTAAATVGSVSGVVTGVSAGTSVISYTLTTGCTITATVTVNPLPSAIAGGGVVCTGATLSLTNPTGGGTWTSSNTGLATVGSSSGIVTGGAAGTPIITYTLPTGCIATTVITVNTTPSAISGTAVVCVGETTALTNSLSGGTWSSSNNSWATVGATTGIVTGVGAGSPVISYTVSGCSATVIVTVNPIPVAITGIRNVCEGATTTLSNATSGGTWSSSNVGEATVVPGTGVVTGVAAGNPVITYTLGTGCFITAAFTVNVSPAAIAGTSNVCVGLTTALSSSPSGGTWTSSNTAWATVGASTGIVTGVAASTPNITYTLSAGTCRSILPITVNPNPAAITGTATVCVGLTTTLSNATTGGSWSSSNTGVATVSGSGLVTGVAAGNATITYMLSTGCISIRIVTVNPLPAAITGTAVVCEGFTTTLSNATSGGTWSSSNTAWATVVSGTGVVTGVAAGNPDITYTLPTGCVATIPLTVNATPVAVSGANMVCTGLTVTLTDATSGGTWSSSDLTLASVGSATGVVTGVAAGTVNISYTLPTGCFAVQPMTVNVQPAAITGASTVCTGFTATLSNATSGGTWTSSDMAVATVGSASGVVSGLTTGIAAITYTMPGGCYSVQPMTVNPTPVAIAGPNNVCVASTITLTSASSGGTWASSNIALATVGALSGTVTGVSAGTLTITYTLPAGCNVTYPITVNPLPVAITGVPVVCVNATTNLFNTTGGGIWSSSNSSLATIGSSTGVVTGVTAGNPTFTYTIPTGCYVTIAGTVNPLPAPFSVTGGGAYCAGGTGVNVGLSGSVVGFSYQLFNGSAVGGPTAGTGSALNFGLMTSAGNYTVVATNNTTGCFVTMTGSATVIINPLPAVFTVTASGTSYCAGGTGITVGLTGSSLGIRYQLFNGSMPSGSAMNGTGSSISFGLKTVAGVYTVVATDTTTACVNNMTGSASISIDPLPTLYTVTGGGAYCAGGAGVNVGLSTSDAGIDYTLLLGGVSTGITLSGSGSALNFGLQTVAGSYTVRADNMTTGCTSTTTSSVTISINPLPTVFTLSSSAPSYCAGGAGVTFSLSGSQTGVNYRLYLDGAPSGSPVAGTGGSFSFGLRTGVGNYTVIATDAGTGCTNNMTGSVALSTIPLPTVYTVTGGGPMCVGAAPVTFGLSGSDLGVNYIVYLGTTPVAVVPGTGGPLTGTSSTAGTYTVVAQSTGTGSCTNNMLGSAVITVNPLPNAYTVTGGGSYCAGGTGAVVGLSSSDLGIDYQLYLSGLVVGSPMAGTGAALNFGPQLTPGTYTVVATNVATLCTSNMTGSVVVSIDPLPALFNVTGGGSYCAGATGLNIGLDGSATGISYQLFNGTSLVATLVGTGGTLDFGVMTVAGTYTIVGTNTTTSCVSPMSGSATIVINPLPVVNTVTGGGSYCAGGIGVDIDLDGSVTTSNYQLYNGTTLMGTAMAGTGIALDFGDWTAPGTYTVVATDLITGCTSLMAGSAVITVDPLPTVYAVTGGGTYCTGGAGVPVGLANSAMGINYQLRLGVTAIGSAVAGTGAAIDFGLQTLGGIYTVVATDAITGCTNNMSGSTAVVINALPAIHTVTGGGNYCSGDAGVDVLLTGSNIGISYQLFTGGLPVGAPMAGTGGSLNFGPQTTAGSYTVVATNIITACTRNMTGSATVTIDPLPMVYTVTGGGAYCLGGAGVHVGLSGSDAGVDYQLYLGTSATGAPMAGTGSALDFGLYTIAGNYTVVAVNATTSCVNNMAGSVTVNINSLPLVYTVTGGGSFCTGGTGVHVGLSGSNTGTNYQLYNGTTLVGSPLAGSGSLLDFGVFTTAGVYTVVAINSSTACTSNMTGSAAITIDPLPNAYTVTGGGSYCIGGAGLPVGISLSDVGVNYQLFRGTSMVGTPVGGTGLALDFGIQTMAGLYTVVATNAVSGCTANMAGSVFITINSLPNAFTVTGGGSYCAGGPGFHIGLSSSAFGVNYQLYNGTTAFGSIVPGTGSPLDFGLISVAGNYTIVATNVSTSCSNTMTGSATITINPLPLAYAVTGGGSYCPGGVGVLVGLAGSTSGINYQLYRGTTLVATMAGNDSTIDFGLQTIAGAYTVVAIDPASSCTTTMTGSAVVVINSLPVVYAVTGGGSYCTGGTGLHVTLAGSSTGVNYQLYRDLSPVGSPVAGTGFVLDMGIHPFAGNYTVVATDAATGCTRNMSGSAIIAINPLPTLFTLTGGGSYCAGGPGLHIILSGSTSGIHYQLFNGSTTVGSPVAGTGSALDFGALTVAGTYTVVAINTFTTCTSTMTGAIAIVVNPLPAVYSVFGGGSYCAGGSGVTVSMTGSQAGVDYQLYRDGLPAGIPVPGAGAGLSFGLQTAPGVYTVIATNTTTTCTSSMTGSATVAVNPLPVLHTVTGGGSYCAGDAGVRIGLSGSSTGISYQLRIGGTNVGAAMAGTGGLLDFGLHTTTATYNVLATNLTTGCTNLMTGTVAITSNPLPIVYTITGGGNYCAGGSGVNIGVGNSETGVNYQLYNGSLALGSPVAGTGSSISFGPQTLAGTYTVVGTNATTTCTSNMAGSTVVTVLPLVTPSVTINTGVGDTICDGTSVVFNALTVSGGGSPAFAWRINGGPSVGGGSSFTYSPVDGDLVSVEMTSSAACATPSLVSDNVTMTVLTNQTPVVTITPHPGDVVCQGTSVTLSLSATYGGTAPSFTWHLNGAPTSVGTTFTYTPVNGDVVFVHMTSNYSCVLSATAISNNVNFRVDQPVAPVVAIDRHAASVSPIDSFVAVITDDPTHIYTYSYQWYINGVIQPGATNSNYVVSISMMTLSFPELLSNCEVSCVVTRVTACGLYFGTGVIDARNTVGVTPVVATLGDVRLVPNPNKGTFMLKGNLGTAVNEEVSVAVLNMLGQVVYSSKIVVRNGEINESITLNSNLANGMYLLNLNSGTEHKVFHMVIEQ